MRAHGRAKRSRCAGVAAAVLLAACGGGGEGSDAMPADAGPPVEDWSHDVVTTALHFDVTSRAATATIGLAGPTASGSASFEVGDLAIAQVSGPDGPLDYQVTGSRMDVRLPPGPSPALTVDYTYQVHGNYDGALASGLTFLWPYFCGNLFPCVSSPADGITFTIALDGVPDGQVAIAPAAVTAEAPSYMVAWAIGDYTRMDLGTTGAGTGVSVWYLPGGVSTATAGTDHLTAEIDWLEQTYGGYRFGDQVGSVAAPWGFGAYGGMEHHPFWHVATASMADDVTHIHEAAHGWFGDGVRLACWEDFVLSEGTVSYLAARAIAAVAGTTAGGQVWVGYQQELDALDGSEPTWPQGCNQIDVLGDGLYNNAPYVRGAFFYRALEARIGTTAIDQALAGFYAARAGTAATFQDLLDFIAADSGYDPSACAAAWLRSTTLPGPSSCP